MGGLHRKHKPEISSLCLRESQAGFAQFLALVRTAAHLVAGHSMPTEDRTFLLTEHVARRWQISPRTLERWRYERRGPAWVIISRRVLYDLATIQAFEATGVCDPGSAKPKLKRRVRRRSGRSNR